TKGNGSEDADGAPGAVRASMAGRMNGAERGSNIEGKSAGANMGTRVATKATATNRGSASSAKASSSGAGSPITDTKKPTISAVLTVRLAIVPVLKNDTKGERDSSMVDSKAGSGVAARSNPRTTTRRRAIALLPIAVVLTIKKTNSMMKTTTRITVALRQDMASRVGAASRAPIEI